LEIPPYLPLLNSPFSRIVLLAIGLGACGCSDLAGPQPDGGVTIPQSFMAGQAIPGWAASGWLRDFSEPQLSAVVSEAMKSNQDLKASAGRLRAARANAGVTRAAGLPQMSASRGTTRRRSVAEIPGGSTVTNYATSHDIGASLNWEVDLWGRIRNRTQAALAEANASAADFHALRLSLAANIARSWFNAAELEQQVRLARETVTSLEKNLNFVERGVDLGTSDALDLRLTRANVANARSNLDAQSRQLDRATRALEILIGRYPARQLQVSQSLPDLKAGVPSGLPSALLERRPDLRASEFRLAAASQRVAEAKKQFLPGFTLTVGGGNTSNELRKLLNPDYLAGSIGANIGQTIFDGGRIKGGIEAAKGRYDAALASYRQNVRQAFGEVETALAAEVFLKSQLRSQKEAAEESTKAEELAWDRYASGLVDGLTWLEAQRRSFNASSGLLQLKNLRLQNRITLHLALGGDFQSRP
jgi:multidrug efflux system outer membrane protein